MSNHLTWEEVLKRDDIVNGDIQIDEDGYILRGPINEIAIENGYVYIRVLWMARRKINRMSVELGNVWEYCRKKFHSVSADILPLDIGRGRISIVKKSDPKSWAIIYPKGDEKLDPANVRGLEI